MMSALVLVAMNLLAPSVDTTREIAALEKTLKGGRIGYCMYRVGDDEFFGYRSNERFPLQSVCKLPLAVAVLSEVEHGRLSLSHVVRITRNKLGVPLSRINEEFKGSFQDFTVLELLKRAVGESDNTACDLLFDEVGGPRKVQAILQGLNLPGIRIDRRERDLQTEVDGLPPFEPSMATEKGFEAAMKKVTPYQQLASLRKYLADPRDTATPNGMGGLLGRLADGALLDKPRTAVLLDIMTKSTTGPNRLRAGLPPSTTLAHKTGTARTIQGGCPVANDVGIALLQGQTTVIVVFVKGAHVRSEVCEKAISAVARMSARTFKPG